MIDKTHSELSYYQKNKDRFKNEDSYFEKLFCNIYNLYTNDLKQFYEMIKDNSKNEKQIIDILNQVITFFSSKEKYEDCHELLMIRNNIQDNLQTIFE